MFLELIGVLHGRLANDLHANEASWTAVVITVGDRWTILALYFNVYLRFDRAAAGINLRANSRDINVPLIR